MEGSKNESSISSVHARFYDKNLQITHDPVEAFEVYDETAVSRFIATYDFEIDERGLVIRLSKILVHLFNPKALLDHIDYISSPILQDEGIPYLKFKEMPEFRKEFILSILNLVVIGGGVLGQENGHLYALWTSASFRHELGYCEPEKPLSKMISAKLRRHLFTLFGKTPKKKKQS